MAVKGKRTTKPRKSNSPLKATTKAKAKATPKKVEPRRVEAEIVEDRAENEERFAEAAINEPDVDAKVAAYSDADESTPDLLSELNGDFSEPSEETSPAPSNSRVPVPVQPVSIPDLSQASAALDPVTTYLAEIRRYPLLTKEQEYELAVRYRETADARAAELLVTSNLRFVVKIATEYSKFGAKLIDLIQEGNVGLMHAVREFNPYKGVRLITYAVWWIRGYIQEYLMRQYSMVRIGTTQAQRKLFYRLQKEKELLDSMGQAPNIKLLSSRLGVSEEDVKTMSQRLSGRDISLNQPLDSSSTGSLLDMEMSNEPTVDERIGQAEELDVLRRNIEAIRPNLNEKELFILDNRVLADEPMTLQEIGDHYGITREAVRQVEARLIGRIGTMFVESVEPQQIPETGTSEVRLENEDDE